MRNKWKGNTGDGNESDSGGELQGNEKDKQPRLNNLTPDYDLKLFMEAQAIASEKVVSIQFMFQLISITQIIDIEEPLLNLILILFFSLYIIALFFYTSKFILYLRKKNYKNWTMMEKVETVAALES